MVYIREAHPTDGRRPSKTVKIEDPKSLGERDAVAKGCSSALQLKMPFLVDDMEDTVSKAYNAKPDRLFILGSDGNVAYRGDRGPRGFKVDELASALKKLLAAAADSTKGGEDK